MKALVIGGADSVWRDVDALEAMLGREWDGLVVAANDVGVLWPRRLDHWTSLHQNKLDKWAREREKRGHPGRATTWSRKGKKTRGIDREVTHQFGGGSSGLLAVSVALEVGATRIVLAGVPMTRTPHVQGSIEHPAGKPFASADSHWKKWRLHSQKLMPYVRSMSGRTRELFGAPTPEWIDATEAAA